MQSGKKWRSAVWLNAMHSGPNIFFLNPDCVAAPFLRSLCSKYISILVRVDTTAAPGLYIVGQ